MTMSLNTAELLFLKALIEDRVEDLDVSLETLRLLRGEVPVSDEETSIALVRTIHSNLLRKIELELDVPFPAVSAWNVQ